MDHFVAVTGGTGFIGRYLIDLLLTDGFKVRALTRNPSKAKALWNGRVEIWHGDVTKPDSLSGFPEGVSIVYNLAGTIFDNTKLTDVNETGTLNLLTECIKHPIERFVHLSSVGVIGSSQHKMVDEKTTCDPVNAYERSKLHGEELVMGFFHDHRTPVTILRPTIVFGIGRKREQDSFASWMQAIQAGRFRFIGHGEYIANYIYAEDVAAACIHVTKHERALGEIYIVADSCPLHDFVQKAADLLKAPPPSTIPLWIAQVAASGSSILEKTIGMTLPLTRTRVQALTSTTTFSSQKLYQTLGFEPKVGYQEGLKQVIRWYQAQGVIAF